MEEISQDEYVAEIKRHQAEVQQSADFWDPAITKERPTAVPELTPEEYVAARYKAVEDMTLEEAHKAVQGDQGRTFAGHRVSETSGRIPPRESNWI